MGRVGGGRRSMSPTPHSSSPQHELWPRYHLASAKGDSQLRVHGSPNGQPKVTGIVLRNTFKGVPCPKEAWTPYPGGVEGGQGLGLGLDAFEGVGGEDADDGGAADDGRQPQ